MLLLSLSLLSQLACLPTKIVFDKNSDTAVLDSDVVDSDSASDTDTDTDTDTDSDTDTDDSVPDTGDSTDSATDTDTSGETGVVPKDVDGDGYSEEDGDCDDARADVNPDASEVCDGTTDENCDGNVDESTAIDASTWYADADADGYGDASVLVVACTAPAGYVADATDCDDSDAAFNPGATESDCADPSDYNCDGSVGYTDLDADGFAACEECNDADFLVNPDAVEVCDDVDNDCNGVTDESTAADASTWYEDLDSDGYGNSSTDSVACTAPAGYVGNHDDCDDASADVSPADTEVCNTIDDNCDGSVDEADVCTIPDTGSGKDTAIDTATEPIDTADTDTAIVIPGDTGTEPIDTSAGVDTAAGSDTAVEPVLTDADGDGAYAEVDDCDDGDFTVNPSATELCDYVDNNCDGTVDEDSAADALTWYADADHDGHGDPTVSTVACNMPAWYVLVDDDCDDTWDDAYPGNTEWCDGVDNDCSGSVDDGDADSDGYNVCDDCDESDAAVNPAASEVCNGYDDNCDHVIDVDAVDVATWYADADSDGYGDAATSTDDCDQPAGYVADATDCDDALDDVNPGTTEDATDLGCVDGVDNDCDDTTGFGYDMGDDDCAEDVDGDGVVDLADGANLLTSLSDFSDFPTRSATDDGGSIITVSATGAPSGFASEESLATSQTMFSSSSPDQEAICAVFESMSGYYYVSLAGQSDSGASITNMFAWLEGYRVSTTAIDLTPSPAYGSHEDLNIEADWTMSTYAYSAGDSQMYVCFGVDVGDVNLAGVSVRHIDL